FFKYILESINIFYYSKIASILLFILYTQKPLNIEIFRFNYLKDNYKNYTLKKP
ncbi:hypothetical protein BGZ61DRAFT_282914, partial [Ilyonectria robusta]|uniref:uncharacterized protein n=1 Tax=Ilyonectria robusta TaxID=1079257 RepID=UPI001E8CCC9F